MTENLRKTKKETPTNLDTLIMQFENIPKGCWMIPKDKIKALEYGLGVWDNQEFTNTLIELQQPRRAYYDI